VTLLFLASSNRFTPQILLSLVPNLGCVIDLTATDRYYRPTVCYCFVCFTSQVVALLFLFYDFLFSYHKLFGASIPFLTLLLFFVQQEFTEQGVRHEKIFCAGHVIPDKRTVDRYLHCFRLFFSIFFPFLVVLTVSRRVSFEAAAHDAQSIV